MSTAVMENVPALNLATRPQSARSATQSGRASARRAQSARSARAHSARSARSLSARSEQSTIVDDDDSSIDFDYEDEEPWVACLENATSAEDGMRRLYEEDQEAFYLHGESIYRMLQFRFEHGIE